MKIGITGKDYPIKRNILGLVKGADYILLRKNNNFFHSLSTLKNLIFKRKINFAGQYYFWQKPKIDILHLFNDINYSKQKWVTTFETMVPRFEETKNDHQRDKPCHAVNQKTKKGLKQIVADNCLGIICLSQNSKDIQLDLQHHYPKLDDKIRCKIFLIPPPQKILNAQKILKKSKNLEFIFIGSEFHRKGGVEMFEVFEKLKQRYDFKLTIISSFKTDHYVTKVSEAEAAEMRERIRKTTWIQHFENIPNEEVLELIKNSHIGLLPTWSDTYGFSVLEMQACGVPVITTDIRALPEINNEACGWLIHLPQNRLKQALYFTDAQKESLKSTLKKQLEEILIGIFEDKAQIGPKAEKSLERIKNEHDPEVVAEKLREIYNRKTR